MPKEKLPVVLWIRWVDSSSHSGWKETSELEAHLMICESIGFLVSENKDAIAIALNRSCKAGFLPFGDIISIPKVAVLSRKRITLK